MVVFFLAEALQCGILEPIGCDIWQYKGPRSSHKSVALVKDWDLYGLVRTQLQLRRLHDEAQIGSLLFDLPGRVCLLQGSVQVDAILLPASSLCANTQSLRKLDEKGCLHCVDLQGAPYNEGPFAA